MPKKAEVDQDPTINKKPVKSQNRGQKRIKIDGFPPEHLD